MKGYCYVFHDWIRALRKDRQKGSSIGVGIFKLARTHPFQRAAKWHDVAYAVHEWPDDTIELDRELLRRMVRRAGNNDRLFEEALAMYRLARGWGLMRSKLARLGIVW